MPAPLEEGYQCLIEFASRPTVKFYEIEVTPHSTDVGSPIDVTTQRNAEYMTKGFRVLKDVGEMTVLCAYEVGTKADIDALLGVNDVITSTYPDGSTIDTNGALVKATFSSLKIGERPTVTLTIAASNRNPTDDTEEGPVYTAD